MVPRRLRSVICRADSEWPNNGSKINDLDLASTAFSSPSINNVPTRFPSRPSRAIATASSIRDSRTSGSYSVIWQRILSNIYQLLAGSSLPSVHLRCIQCWMKSPPGRLREPVHVTQRNIFSPQPSGTGRFRLSYFGAFVFGPFIGFLQMPSKLIPHRGQDLIGKFCFAPGAESLIKCSGENWRWNRFVDRRFNRPPSFTRIRDVPGKL